ncbi:MAG: hypothetical protein HC915_14260 [Anaerolineae bacterium]|nr:hypothetical protein [Anaerolineae bacterium]
MNPPDPRHRMALATLEAIQKHLEEARTRDDHERVRVDLLAIVQYIPRQASLVEQMPEAPHD